MLTWAFFFCSFVDFTMVSLSASVLHCNCCVMYVTYIEATVATVVAKRPPPVCCRISAMQDGNERA